MQAEDICRCCLSAGFHKDLNATYTYFDKKEVYSVMLRDCFCISLDTYNSPKICELCIKDLRSAVHFKAQVLKSGEEFRKRIQGVAGGDQILLKIKVEHVADSDDSDDYFLADVKDEISLENIKDEAECVIVNPEKKGTKKSAQMTTGTSGKRQTDKIKTIVNRLASTNSISISRTNSDLKLSKNSKQVEIKRMLARPNVRQNSRESKINFVWMSRSTNEKIKHKENLQTILKFSNATPFKNKSLLGFICGFCEAAFPDPKDLRTHTEMDHSKQRLEYKSNFEMSEYHVKLDVSDLTCSLCEAKLDNLTALKEHLVKIHGKSFYNDIKDHIQQYKLKKGDVYDCALCTSTYETFKMLKQHMNKHYGNYTCSKCQSSYATKRSLSAHKTTHQEGNFKCDYCDKVFGSRPKKQSHEKMTHFGARNIGNCPFCNESFTSYYQRNQHLVKVHNAEAKYKCNVCSRTFILKSLLMAHIKKSHLMERNCQCTECGFRFFSQKGLKAHMVKHTGERLFTCEICNKSYARKYTLREHMRIHNNDRRFKCDVCTMSFVQKCSLKSHLLTNHGISMAASDITSA